MILPITSSNLFPLPYHPITVIFNSVFKLRHFPSLWKCAKIIPILNPSLWKTDPSSYHPISLFNTFPPSNVAFTDKFYCDTLSFFLLETTLWYSTTRFLSNINPEKTHLLVPMAFLITLSNLFPPPLSLVLSLSFLIPLLNFDTFPLPGNVLQSSPSWITFLIVPSVCSIPSVRSLLALSSTSSPLSLIMIFSILINSIFANLTSRPSNFVKSPSSFLPTLTEIRSPPWYFLSSRYDDTIYIDVLIILLFKIEFPTVLIQRIRSYISNRSFSIFSTPASISQYHLPPLPWGIFPALDHNFY